MGCQDNPESHPDGYPRKIRRSADPVISPESRRDILSGPDEWLDFTYKPIMSLFRDSTPPICHDTNWSGQDTISNKKLSVKRHLPLRFVSAPSLPSVFKSSLSWAEDSFQTYRDGLSKEERQERGDRENWKQALYLRMRSARSYDEWQEWACELDHLEDHNSWKQKLECLEYDSHLVHERLKQLEDARINCDVSRMLFLIRTSLNRDLGGMSNASLYRHSHFGTKDLIDRYITTAVDTIAALVDLSGQNRCDEGELKYILDQLLETRQSFGRSALLFSGGATFGMNHIGVLKVLWQTNLLPRIISGASAGSIICAVFCTRTDDELPTLLDSYPYGDFSVFDEPDREENVWQRTARFLKYGSFLDISHLARVMRAWLGDITFQEAYYRTRRILNICVSSAGVYELPRLLNYITAPNVLIWSAVAVSCSVPIVYTPFVLMAKDPSTERPVPWNDFQRQYIDGSVDGDLPMTRLSEMFNVNHFIVSQVNPHVVPFLLEDEGPNDKVEHEHGSEPTPGWLNTLTYLAKDEILHRMSVLSELGVFPTALTKFASIMNQKYSGDITIYPEIQYSNIPRMLKNPTTEFMLEACASGERATWPKLGRVRNHVAIELALDAAVQKTRARVALSYSQIDMRRLAGQTRYWHSIDSFDSNGGQGRLHHQRRNSYSYEFEKNKQARRNSALRLTSGLRRSRSALSFEQPVFIPAMDLDATINTDDWNDDHPNHLANAGDGPSTVRAPSENGARRVWDRRQKPSGRRASWGPASGGPSIWSGQYDLSSRFRRVSSSSLTDFSKISYSWTKPVSPLRDRPRLVSTSSDRYFDLSNQNSFY